MNFNAKRAGEKVLWYTKNAITHPQKMLKEMQATLAEIRADKDHTAHPIAKYEQVVKQAEAASKAFESEMQPIIRTAGYLF